MAKYLVIVESPAKVKTIKKFLGANYDVEASNGHVRDFPKSQFGIDVEHDFEPKYITIRGKGELLAKLRKAAKKADKIYLATDPDREGEAISWHIYDLLKEIDKSKCQRITFNEISKKAIISAIENKHDLDMNLVYSQFTRRIIDRLVGYKLSDLVRRTVYGKSAGRVQSVALMFIVSRELERRNFVSSKWYEISAELQNGLVLTYTANNQNFKPYNDSSANKYNFKFAELSDAQSVIKKLTNEFKFVKYLPDKETKGDKYVPLTTDKMLQIAGTSLGWSASKTTLVAQKLFEGIELNGRHLGLITYPRTDSERINEDFIHEAQNYLNQRYGQEYVNFDYQPGTKKTKKKDENIQDAHEAIRPVDVSLTPEDVKPFIDESAYKLYNLI